MDLTLLFDHRFYESEDGSIDSLKHYRYSFFAERYLQVFDRMRIVARVFNNAAGDTTYEYRLGNGVELISLGDWNGPVEFLRKSPAIRSRLREYLSKDTSVIMISPGAVSSLARKMLVSDGHPYAVEVVTDPYDAFAPNAVKHPLRPFFRNWFTRQLKHQCAGAIAATYVTKEALQRRYPCPAYSIGVSDVQISNESLAPAPRQFCPGTSQFSLITVGTLAQLYKAPDILISAVAECVRNGMDLNLVVIGDGKHRSELESQAATLGLEKRVSFLGQVAAGRAVRDQLDRSDLFVLPSRQEGLPRALVEAMARGLPCIGSTVGGIPELLPSEDLVTPGDVTSLANRIREVVTNPERMTQMSIHNLEKAKEYNEEILREQWIAFYKEVRERTAQWMCHVH